MAGIFNWLMCGCCGIGCCDKKKDPRAATSDCWIGDSFTIQYNNTIIRASDFGVSFETPGSEAASLLNPAQGGSSAGSEGTLMLNLLLMVKSTLY